MKTLDGTFIHVMAPEIRDGLITEKAPLTRTLETSNQLVTETTTSKTHSTTILTFKVNHVVISDDQIISHMSAEHALIAYVSDYSAVIAGHPEPIR